MRIVLPAPDQSVVLEGVSWEELERLLAELGDSGTRRVAYDHGTLEIVSPSPRHERIAELLGLCIRALAEELGLECVGTGSWTLRRSGLERAVEGDRTFYVANERVFRAARDPDLDRIPPPDIAVEVDVTRKCLDRLSIYAELGVPEIWRWSPDGRLEVYQLRGESLRAGSLRGESYERTDTSLSFQGVPVTEIAGFVERGLDGSRGDSRLAREVRAWVRDRIGG